MMLSVENGEKLVLLGDNGSGKTRLAASLARLDGVKFLTFRDSYGYASDREYFMQQRWNLFTLGEDTPSAAQTLEKIARGMIDPEAALRRLSELSKTFSLGEMLDRPLITLSSGELRKYQIIKALISSPKILVIDNPYIGLDPGARKVLNSILSRLDETLVMLLSRADEIPPFTSHVMKVGSEKMSLKEYEAGLPGEVIRIRNLSIKYGSRTVIDGLDWVVREGERWVLTGGNGSGKSTLLSLICADNPRAYACDIELFGRPRGSGESIWDIKRNIGYVSPEMHRSYGNASAPAIDLVASGLFDTEGLFRKPTDAQRAMCMEWMERFGIENLAQKPFSRLSSGEQRLCLVARAFVKRPPLLILDEPLHGLDNPTRQKVKRIIDEECSQKGRTLIMVSHYPEEYPSCIDHSLSL